MADDAPVPPPPTPSTPEDELAKKQVALKQAQDDVTTAAQKVTSIQDTVTLLQGEVRDLQAKIAEIQQAQAGYDKTSVSQQQQLDDDKKTIGQKNSIADAVLKDLKNQVDVKVADFEKALNVGDAAVKTAWDNAQTAAADSKAADAIWGDKQTKYDQLKRGSKDNEAALKDVAELLGQAGRAEAQSDFVAMYFLVSEAKKVADTIKILSTDDYNKALRTAQDDAEKAKKDAANKKGIADQLSATHATAKQNQDAKRKSRLADLLNLLKTIQPKAV